jgi:hypothetical protein
MPDVVASIQKYAASDLLLVEDKTLRFPASTWTYCCREKKTLRTQNRTPGVEGVDSHTRAGRSVSSPTGEAISVINLCLDFVRRPRLK